MSPDPSFKSSFEVTASSPEYNLPSGYYTTGGARSNIWHEGPPPDAPPGYVPPASTPSVKPKYQPHSVPLPVGLSFVPDDVLSLGHRHSTFRSIEGTRAILSAHGCESSYEAKDLPQPKLNALCFAFVVALGRDNHPSLLLQPEMTAFTADITPPGSDWKPVIPTIFSGLSAADHPSPSTPNIFD